ncbi:uncharacterized protein N7483_004525 [Penicillium malachiteum]|uniref:uncharacterized protein n=1 Tax=Penicillium malachiteum TaxID=1324776 RepID=UPI0025480E95|nr:uncharacterized protein N7483_004525 [Penicillium malachiteum]KAJ5730017.1 hypothetical protein N7483_004525 [Penicillium malachiteum]
MAAPGSFDNEPGPNLTEQFGITHRSGVVIRKPKANLGELPLEVLEMITKHMGRLDIVCLALCNHWLFSCLSTVSFRNFYSGHESKFFTELLDRLDRSEPRVFICYSCNRLHRVQDVSLPGPVFTEPGCFSPQKTKYHSRFMTQPIRLIDFPCYADYKFYFVHLQLAMRDFYRGRGFGIPLESFFYTEVSTGPIGRKDSISHEQQISNNSTEKLKSKEKTLLSVDARICINEGYPSLCLRIQQLALVESQDTNKLIPQSSDHIRICWHIRSGSTEIDDLVRQMVRRFRSGERGSSLVEQNRCSQCNTSWKIQVREVEVEARQKSVCLVITRWIDLGPGISPKDPRWRSLIESKHTLENDHIVSEPRARFERNSMQALGREIVLSEEAIFWRNVGLLCGERYLDVMVQMDSSRWYLSADEDGPYGKVERIEGGFLLLCSRLMDQSYG